MHIIAHRGFNGRYPEMSSQAYEKALELPIHGVECDIRLSRDGVVVCTHDRTMARVAGVDVAVSAADVGKLKECNIGEEDNPQQLLTLDELLDMVFATDKHIYIEPKHPVRQGMMLEEQLVMRLRYRGLQASDRIHVISFSHASMRRMKRLAPKLETFYLRREWEQHVNPKDVFLSRPSGAGMSIERAKKDPWLINRRGMPPYLFTVNEAEDMRFARDHGVQVMATDFPDLALEVLR